ncbi:MAG: DUF92 domain-containing protein [Thaumarchaeota archaeon]|nr:DUF92 domain-containing protein [Candidatus Calditenuaceae archaeon]MDW8187079.1 DUF92 domain-containing protein [Nitrososphaerota archaeon]
MGQVDPNLLLEATLVLVFLGVLIWRTRVLDIKGTAAALAVGAAVYFTIGRGGIVVLLTFLTISAAFTRIGYDRKKALDAAELKGGIRGWKNVLGNGSVAAGSAILYQIDPSRSHLYSVAMICSIAAVFADTLATEIGLLSRGRVLSIIGLREVRPGEPGGVTLYGYGGATLAGVMTWAVSALSFPNPLGATNLLGATLTSALLGTTVDSLVGQLIQGRYVCKSCGVVTEHLEHCGLPTTLVSGLKFVDNHVVNTICSLTGAVVGVVYFSVT